MKRSNVGQCLGTALIIVAGALSTRVEAQGTTTPFPGVLVSATWLSQHLGDSRIRLFQVGFDDSAYRTRHLPGAQLLTIDSIAVERDGKQLEVPSLSDLRARFERLGVSDSSWVVVYGSPAWLAARAFFTLDEMGLTHLAVLNGGLPAWSDQGGSVTSEVPHYGPGRLTARPRGAVVDADWVKVHLTDAHIVLLDTRSDSEYQGLMRHRGLAIKGHLPGARLVHWQSLVRDSGDGGMMSGTDLALRDSAELAVYYRQRTGPVDSVVTYCHVGARASLSYFVARYLGYAVRLYDGSYEDWAAHGYPLRASGQP